MRMLSVFLMLMANSVCAGEIIEAKQQRLVEFVHQDCGSCHGLHLDGGLGPALTSEALTGKNIDYLTHVIREGRSGTPMPPWKYVLNDSEIAWIAQYLKNPGGRP